MSELDYKALLDLARKEANANFERIYSSNLRAIFEPERKAMVVKLYLERISPIKVDEAY